MKLIWSEGALSDWNVIARYIAVNFGKKGFDEFDEKTTEAESLITQFPGSGSPIKTHKHQKLGLKFVSISDLSKMIYHVDSDKIVIDVIWDTRQNPKRLAQKLSKI